MNLANAITILRLLLLPLIAGLFLVNAPWAAWAAFILYILGALSDWLDGWVARTFNQITPLGTLLDPIADKIYVGAMLILLAGFDRLPGPWIILAVLIIAREFLISGLREYLGPKHITLPVSGAAKIKTTLQMLATALLIIGPYTQAPLQEIGLWALLAATILTVYTGWIYMRECLKHIK
jgi:cardiolipin synthase